VKVSWNNTANHEQNVNVKRDDCKYATSVPKVSEAMGVCYKRYRKEGKRNTMYKSTISQQKLTVRFCV